MAIKIAINGYGRIGRNILKALYEATTLEINTLDVVAIDDINEKKTLSNVTLGIKNSYDSVLDDNQKPSTQGFKFSREFVKSCLDNPKKISDLSPIAFEHFVGELYTGLGYNVTITRQTRDEGVDLIIKKEIDGMLHTYAVQCKHTTRVNRKLGVSSFRELLGTVIDKGVTAGIMVTNSLLSSPAVNFVKKHASKLFSVCSKGLVGLIQSYIQVLA